MPPIIIPIFIVDRFFFIRSMFIFQQKISVGNFIGARPGIFSREKGNEIKKVFS